MIIETLHTHTHAHWLILQILSRRRRDGIVIECMHVIHGRGVHTGVSGKGIDRLLSGEQMFVSVCASTIYVNSTFSLLMAHAKHFNVHCVAYHYTHTHTYPLYSCILAYLLHRSRPTMGGRLHESTG